MRDRLEILEQADEADDRLGPRPPTPPQLDYERGVRDALLWALGDTDDPPFPVLMGDAVL